MPRARTVSFIDDITAVPPPELTLDMAAVAKATEWVQERLENSKDIPLNRRTSQTLLADGAGPEHLTEKQCTAMVDTGSRWSDRGCGWRGYQLEQKNSKRNFLQEVSDGEPAELIRALVR